MKKFVAILAIFSALFLGAIDLQTASKSDLMEIKGIGEKKAKKIVDVLGKDTLQVILEDPNNLVLIPTITKANADILHEKLKEYVNEVSSEEYEKFLGERSMDLEKRLEENKDVFKRLKDR